MGSSRTQRPRGMPIAPAFYTLELVGIERDQLPATYRLRMCWRLTGSRYRRYRKTWKYKVIQNAMNKLNSLTAHYGQPKEVSIFGYTANIEDLGLRISGPAEPL